MRNQVDITYAPDDYGVHRPVVTVTNPSKECMRMINLRALYENAPKTVATQTRIRHDYNEVANAWNYLITQGFHPTRDVADVYGVTYATAAQWVSRCRQRGLIAGDCNER